MIWTKQAAIFDVDGTLIDSMGQRGWSGVSRQLFEMLGCEPSEALLAELSRMSVYERIAHLVEGGHTQKSYEEGVRFCEGIITRFYREVVTPFPDSRPFLAALKDRGVPMCVLTSTPRHLVSIPLRRFELDGYFSFVVTDEDLKGGKHNPAIFTLCAERLGVSPGDTVVFEDSAYAAKTAKSAGFAVCGLLTGTSDAELPDICDLTVRRLGELM